MWIWIYSSICCVIQIQYISTYGAIYIKIWRVNIWCYICAYPWTICNTNTIHILFYVIQIQYTFYSVGQHMVLYMHIHGIQHILYLYYICGYGYIAPYVDAPCANTQVHTGNIYHVHINVWTHPQKAYVLCVYYICGTTYKTHTYKTPCIDTHVLCTLMYGHAHKKNKMYGYVIFT